MKRILILLISLLTSFVSSSQFQEISINDITIGRTIKIESNILEEKRALNIYFPPSYETDTLESYPVIYLLDGSKDEDFIHVIGIVQFGSFSWINMVPESIAVGISNVDRKKISLIHQKTN